MMCMKNSMVSIDHIKIASPCPANWDEMKGDARARFCSQCNLNVYNLSEMTRQEATAFVSKAEGRVCVKFYQREDGTMMTKDCPVGLKLFRQRVRGISKTVLASVMSLIFFTEGVFAATSAGKKKGKRNSSQHWRKNYGRRFHTIGIVSPVEQPHLIPVFPQSDPPLPSKQEPDQSPPPPSK
jgi:hypothetical protein